MYGRCIYGTIPRYEMFTENDLKYICTRVGVLQVSPKCQNPKIMLVD